MRKQRGFSLLELSVTISLTVLLLFILMGFALQSSRQVRKVDARNTSVFDTRLGFEKLTLDIKMADAVLSRYPRGGNAFATSSTADTIILRIPRSDNQGNVLPNEWDVVIYRLVPNNNNVTRTNGDLVAAGVLERWTASMTATTDSTPVRAETIGRTITSLNFEYGGIDRLEGNGSTRNFGLEAIPQSNGNEFVQSVLVNGREWLGTMASFNNDRVAFTWAPRGGTLIDVLYPTNVGTSLDAFRRTAVDQVSVSVRFRTKWSNARNQERENMGEFQSNIVLLNRGA